MLQQINENFWNKNENNCLTRTRLAISTINEHIFYKYKLYKNEAEIGEK